VATRKLPKSTKFFWGIGQAAEGVKNSAFNSFLLFYYNQILGVSATLTALALAIAVLFDAMSDPLVGSISDRFQSRWGRRHPFMAASAAPMAITLFLLFYPPAGMSEMFYFGWVTLFAISVRTFLTLYQIPHLALGAEMATDYEDRNGLFSVGLFFGAVAGWGFWFSMLTFIFQPQPDLPNGMYNADGYPRMAASAGIIAVIAIMLCIWGTRKEIPNLSLAVPARESLGFVRLFNELKIAFSSRSYRSIFFGLMLGTLVLSVEAVFTPFMGIHFWGLETDQLRWLGVGVLLGLGPGSLAAAYLVRILDKKWCLIIPAVVATINANVLIVLRLFELLPENGHWSILPLLIAASCVGGSVVPIIYITINSMFADISDELELATGERQEGIVYSARAFAGKAAAALGTVMGGFALDFIAFPKNAMPGTVDANVIFNLGLFQGPVTSIFTLGGLALYLRYTLNRVRHEEIVTQLIAQRKLRLHGQSEVPK
jgi:Na+/melibiose symporter-like transporter|tara:strand:- start:914 stop:2371 length:1458 start_codon:yes stop_codon:yes gene_type:complete